MEGDVLSTLIIGTVHTMSDRRARYFIIIYIDGEYDCTLAFNGSSIEDVKKQFKYTYIYRMISYEVSGIARILNERYEELESMHIKWGE